MALLQSNSLYQYSFTSRIHDIDAAGVLFFARSLYHAHDAYEAFLKHRGQSIAQQLKSDRILPIRHTEANFKAPIYLDEEIRVELFLAELLEDEFTLRYQFINSDMVITTSVLTRHVCLNKKNWKRISLPESIRSLLKYKP